ncbi:neurotrophin 1, partial [Bombyx mandarina]|uniref:Neurotrophin 1 n=1 Tax=Bombyx mandarina TaxID=7092 RepID=A0A6J2JKV8_BOMMA
VLSQVRSMFGRTNTTTDLMLPILLHTANLIRRAVRPGKETREVRLPQPQILRRSFSEDTLDEPFDIGVETSTLESTRARNRRVIPPRSLLPRTNNTADNKTNVQEIKPMELFNKTAVQALPSTTTSSSLSTASPRSRSLNLLKAHPNNSSLDLVAESTNQTLAQDLPVAEKLRALNRFVDRKGAVIRRGTYPRRPSPAARRTTPEPPVSATRRRPTPARKLPTLSANDSAKCELFTNSLCLHSEDYPTDAIVQSIRRNKAAAGALLADYKDPEEGALDGITPDQEAKYTADHYLVSDRRGDTANRDFASAGEAGFMCPSTVKYARPQRARATSGHWKYIVNTGEHTQTLRLEKCLKPKDSCTYLTDNFQSKCVQVYNYHRLLTWDQQNGLHMDIFKVPTCCSCHIEGYSVSFPPLGHRVHETSSEHFPGEDLSSEHGNNAFESVQSSVHRPTVKSPPFTHHKPLESFPPFSDSHNLVAGQTFSKISDNEELNLGLSNPMDSYGNTYFPDSFNQASSIKSIRKPSTTRNPTGKHFDSITLPSYLEPPTPSASASFSFVKESSGNYKSNGNQFKRGSRPSRRPLKKKISAGPDDLSAAGTSAVETLTSSSLETSEDFNDYSEEPDIGQAVAGPAGARHTIAPKLHGLTTEKVTTTPKSRDPSTDNHEFTSNGKRINYNYHPIIDFFGEDEREAEESIDREDSELNYVPATEAEWKPINHPQFRNLDVSNTVDRKKP